VQCKANASSQAKMRNEILDEEGLKSVSEEEVHHMMSSFVQKTRALLNSMAISWPGLLPLSESGWNTATNVPIVKLAVTEETSGPGSSSTTTTTTTRTRTSASLLSVPSEIEEGRIFNIRVESIEDLKITDLMILNAEMKQACYNSRNQARAKLNCAGYTFALLKCGTIFRIVPVLLNEDIRGRVEQMSLPSFDAQHWKNVLNKSAGSS
jgi:hypothetical protein